MSASSASESRPAPIDPGPDLPVELQALPGPISTVLEKLEPVQRAEVNRAIADRDPPTYREIHQRFRLAEKGIGYHAFYRYARRLRAKLDERELAELAPPDRDTVLDLIPRLVARRLLEAALDDASTPGALQRLVVAWRLALRTADDFSPEPADKAAVRDKQVDDLRAAVCNLARAHLESRFGPLPHNDAHACPA